MHRILSKRSLRRDTVPLCRSPLFNFPSAHRDSVTARGNTDTCYLKRVFSAACRRDALCLQPPFVASGSLLALITAWWGGGLHHFYILLVVHSNQTLKNRLVCSWGELSHCIDVNELTCCMYCVFNLKTLKRRGAAIEGRCSCEINPTHYILMGGERQIQEKHRSAF